MEYLVVDELVRRYPPLNEITQIAYPNMPIRVYNLDYVNSLPMIKAYGVFYCLKLSLDDPDRAVPNPDSLGIFALDKSDFNSAQHCPPKNCSFDSVLGSYLHRMDWGLYNGLGVLPS